MTTADSTVDQVRTLIEPTITSASRTSTDRDRPEVSQEFPPRRRPAAAITSSEGSANTGRVR